MGIQIPFIPIKIPKPLKASWKFIPFKLDDPFIENEYNGRKYVFLKYQQGSLHYKDWEFDKSDYIKARMDIYVFCWLIGGSRKHVYQEHAFIIRPKEGSRCVIGNTRYLGSNISEHLYRLEVENAELIVDFAQLPIEEIESLKVYLLNKGYSVPKIVSDEFCGSSFWNSIACAYVMKNLLENAKQTERKAKRIIIEASENEIEEIIYYITKIFPNIKIERI